MTKQQTELLIEQVRARYDFETVKDILVNLGYEFDRSNKFKLRPEEHTSSASINKNGLINDFGSGGGDIIKILIDYRAMPFMDALKYVADQMGLIYPQDNHQESEQDRHQRQQQLEAMQRERQLKQEQQSKIDHQNLMQKQTEAQKTIAWYDSYAYELQTFHNPEYQREALAIAPMWLYKEATKQALQNFKNITTYDHKNKTLIAKIFDYNYQLISYKSRRFNNGKWITKSGTSPNNQCFVSVDPIGTSPVYIIEGHHDMLTAILMQGDKYEPFDFIMVPTENYKEFNKYEMAHLIEKDVHFILDLKYLEDGSINQKAYYKLGMHQLAEQVKKQTGKECVGIDLKDFLKSEKYNVDHIKNIDLSDAVFMWQNGLSAFKGALQFYVDSRRK